MGHGGPKTKLFASPGPYILVPCAFFSWTDAMEWFYDYCRSRSKSVTLALALIMGTWLDTDLDLDL